MKRFTSGKAGSLPGRRRIGWWAVLVLLLVPLRAHAQASAEVSANYALYLIGVRTAEMRAHLVYSPTGYAMDLATHTIGVAQILVRGQQLAEVRGTWGDGGPRPLHYATDGTWNGDPHRTVIDFAGGMPSVTLRVPAEKEDHMAIPPDLLRDTIDTLSGVAAMAHQVAVTGRCDQHAHTFDGLHVLDVTARTIGQEALAVSDRSAFSGLALRCDFEGTMIAGFTRGEEARQRRPLHASVWLARITPDGPPTPVKASFETRYFGDATLYLVPPPAVATQ